MLENILKMNPMYNEKLNKEGPQILDPYPDLGQNYRTLKKGTHYF